MIGFTAKITKTRLFSAIAIILIPLLIFSAMYITKAKAKENVSLEANTTEQRIEFLKHFGYAVEDNSETVKDTSIPSEFDNVYDAYNSIQTAQGFDLSDYKGQTVKLYNLKITNYPKDSEYVYATLLVKDGIIIGGDIHSTSLYGFMHGFEM